MSSPRPALASLCLVLLVMGGAALAQKPQEQVFKDKQGRLKLWNMDSHEIRVQNQGPIKFEGEGRPIRGISQDQGLTLECHSLTADLATLKGKGYVLQSADLTGSVSILQSREGSSRSFKGDSLRLDDSGSSAKVTLSRPFDMVEKAKVEGGEAVRTLSASRGVISLETLQSSKGGFKSANAEGTVVFILNEPLRETTLKSSRADIVQGQGFYAFDLPSAFNLNGSNKPKPGEHNIFSASADSGKASILEKSVPGENSLLSLDLKGNVSLHITSTVKTDKGEKTRIVKAKASSLVFSRETGLMTLGGSVAYSLDSAQPGEEPIEAEGASDILEITFDKSGRLLNAAAKSGRTNIKQGGKP